MLIDENIDRATRNTIMSLLQKYNGRYGSMDLPNVRVSEDREKRLCPICMHSVTAHEYRATGSLTSVMTYASCDCGWTQMTNWGGMMVTRQPGGKPTLYYSDKGRQCVYVSEPHFEKILESRLITKED